MICSKTCTCCYSCVHHVLKHLHVSCRRISPPTNQIASYMSWQFSIISMGVECSLQRVYWHTICFGHMFDCWIFLFMRLGLGTQRGLGAWYLYSSCHMYMICLHLFSYVVGRNLTQLQSRPKLGTSTEELWHDISWKYPHLHSRCVESVKRRYVFGCLFTEQSNVHLGILAMPILHAFI